LIKTARVERQNGKLYEILPNKLKLEIGENNSKIMNSKNTKEVC